MNYLNNGCRFNWVNEVLLSDRLDAKNYKKEYIELKKTIMKQNYLMIKDVIEDINNGYELNRDYSDVGINYITISDLREFEINYSNVKKINLKFNDVPEKGKLRVGDIIISRSGSIGIAKTITNNDVESIISYDIMKLRVSNKIDQDYLTIYLNSSIGRKLIEQLSYGAVMKKIGQEEFLNLLIPNPFPEIQKYIGDKVRKAEELKEEAKKLKKEAEEVLHECLELSNLNNKLLNIKKINWIRESLIDDRLDLKYNSPSMISIYNHLKKFECFYIKDEFETVSGYSFSSVDFSDFEGGRVIKIGDISNYFIDSSNLTKVRLEHNVKNKVGKIICSLEDLTYAMTGATIGKVAIYANNDNAYLNQRVACIKSKGKVPTGYLLLFLSSEIGREISYNLSSGVAQPNIALEEISNIVIPRLDSNIMWQIHQYVIKSSKCRILANNLIKQAKQDIEDLIEGNFDVSKIKESN